MSTDLTTSTDLATSKDLPKATEATQIHKAAINNLWRLSVEVDLAVVSFLDVLEALFGQL